MKVLLYNKVLRSFLVFPSYSFLLSLFDRVRNPSTFNFLFLQAFSSFTDLVVIFFRCFTFLLSHYKHVVLFYAKLHSYILVVYSLYKGFLFVFIFGKRLDIIYIHFVVHHILWFCIFAAPPDTSEHFPRFIIIIIINFDTYYTSSS